MCIIHTIHTININQKGNRQMTDRHRTDSTHKRIQRAEAEAISPASDLREANITLKGINKRLDDIGRQVEDIYITEKIKQEVKTLKEQVNEMQKDLKKYKKYEGQLKDLNRELHDFTKWKYAVEAKIGAIEV